MAVRDPLGPPVQRPELTAMPEALDAAAFWPEIEALLSRVVAAMSADPWYLQLGRMFYALRGRPAESGPTERAIQVAQSWLGAVIARGRRLGVVRDDLPESLLVESAMGLGEALDRWTVAHWDEIGAEERLVLAARQMDLLKRLLAPDGRG